MGSALNVPRFGVGELHMGYRGAGERGKHWLILKKLKIEQFGRIKRFDASFREQLAVITAPNAGDIVKAIGLATNNKSLTGQLAPYTIFENTHIHLELEAVGHTYSITARGQPCRNECAYEAKDCESNAAIDVAFLFRNMQLCEEEEELTYYRYDPKNAFSERFLHYKDPERYYSLDGFHKRTNGAGSTQSFRICLGEFIKKYGFRDPFPDVCKIGLCADGSFIGYSADAPGRIVDLNAVDKKLFDYSCYLAVNEFWGGFEDIRDINHEKWPMIVDAEDMRGHIGFKELLVKSKSLGRQLLVLSTNNYDSQRVFI